MIKIRRIENLDIEKPQFPQYAEVVNKDTSAQNWLKAFALLPKSIDNKKLQSALLTSLYGTRPLSETDLIGGKIDLREMDHISHIANETIPVPTLSFAQASDYRKFMSKIGYRYSSAPQGVSIPLNFAKFLTTIGITEFEQPLRSMHIIAYCEEQLPSAMPPNQILRHESVHAIDPLLEVRRGNDTLVLTEMIATIGEFASSNDDFVILNSFPHFWESYLKQIQNFTPEFFRVFDIKEGASYQEAAESIVSFVKEITTGRSNTDIVRMLMNCKSFSDLEDKLVSVMPNRRKETKREEVAHKTRDDVEEILLRKKLSTVMHTF
ncbi:MAG: hypothetical protein UR28_C0039G0034 [Candidatus Peregrinibacteria bacterium GW2011_GWF2_33_10]|nr:MAG: hypothetical protein UR28_C0039G0034 [Candidatus Peregrinibacteria bacterium GW2011_GWF2_33_10]